MRTAIYRHAAAHDDRCPEREARSRRIRTAKRDVERALRSRDQLQEAIHVTDAAAGHAVRLLLDEGLTAVDTAVLLGLSRSQIKRLLRVTADSLEKGSARSSTEQISGGASNVDDVDRENGAARSATNGGNV
jgi:hypothetical protein